MASATSGIKVGVNVAYETDGIHPDDPGHAALMPLAKNAISALQTVQSGSLIVS
ncbi:hypothetical protein [Devosia aquimaris]|uniref:hypothetical protein n=1 Tax=Devosia aquimaris TaxID=2866214 RepID=UPI001CD14345|nr:hypothetical protein [Devosia sp. CJK-A8-3]